VHPAPGFRPKEEGFQQARYNNSIKGGGIFDALLNLIFSLILLI
jgi:hypothetical protein